MSTPDQESIRLALDKAWAEHHHVRDQTWRALQAEVVLAAGLVGIDVGGDNLWATVAVGLVVMVGALCGAQITIRHRNQVEVLKFTLIGRFEKALHLDSIIQQELPVPKRIRFFHAFLPWKNNTALFILRMHVAILIFAAVFVAARLFGT